MSDVYFRKAHPSQSRIGAVKDLVEKSGILSKIEKDDMVAIKLHVGELGNPYHVQPIIVRTLVDCIREKGGNPFLTDTTSYYVYKRHNALDHISTAIAHGFGYENVGAPFIVADGLGFSPGHLVQGHGVVKEVHMAEIFSEASFLLVFSHCKGHALTGFGGALKNVGMGCATKRTKFDQHRAVGYSIDEEKCIGCGKCNDACPLRLPQVVEGKAKMDSDRCMRCPMCRDSCPKGAITLVELTQLQKAVASVSAAVLGTFEKKAFLSAAMSISLHCDCMDAPGGLIAPDIGYFASTDPVAVDRAFLDAVGVETIRKAHGLDPEVILKEAERLGAGQDRVNLIPVGTKDLDTCACV